MTPFKNLMTVLIILITGESIAEWFANNAGLLIIWLAISLVIGVAFSFIKRMEKP